MSKALPRLRAVLDAFPSPDPEQPGLLLSDPFRYSDAIIFLSPLWARALGYLDGRHSELDLREFLTRATGEIALGDNIEKFLTVLRANGFLETEEFEQLKAQKQNDFRNAADRIPVHAGRAYPAAAADLSAKLAGWMNAADAARDGLPGEICGLAAPHVSPEGGSASYAAAYARLPQFLAQQERTIVVLGTSHYGQPERFGLTRKPFLTPFGSLAVDTDLAGWLEQRAGPAIVEEDYCHAIEHSIEFQCLFLQHALGANVRILPILCGPFAESLETGRPPESNEVVARFFDALGEMAEHHSRRLFWVLGIDLAHVGARYGDPIEALADRGPMLEVAEKDRRRLESVCGGDAAGFFDQVRPNHDELKWCGYSPVYTFLKAMPAARGSLLRYEQWNIDPQSVVSFAALEFFS